MRGYGLPRILDIEFPDVADIRRYALKSAIGTPRGKGGDFRGYFKRKQQKRNSRRVWKRRERLKAKIEIRKQLRDYE